jgi:hypothetical protein
MRKLSVVSVVGAALLAVGSVAYAGPLADATADSLWGIQLGGYLDVSYTYDFNDPNDSDDSIGGRAFGDDDNQIQLDAFQLYIDKLPTDAGEVGFRFDILAGEDAEWFDDLFGGRTNDINIYQAFISYIAPIGNGLTIDVGRFAASAGYESIESPANDHFSRSMLFTMAQPWTQTGVRATYAFNDQWEVTGGLSQGWDVVEDDNEAWTFNGAVRWMPMESVYIQEAVYYGPEMPDDNDNYTLLNDLVATWDINESWTVGANFDYITEDNGSVVLNEDGDMWGLGGYVRYNVNEDMYLALRGEWMDDGDGWACGAADNELWEVTATLGYTVTEGLLTRLEFRHDSADADMYADEDVADDQQDTIAVEVIYSF